VALRNGFGGRVELMPLALRRRLDRHRIGLGLGEALDSA
jgi:hypothetical protein